MSDLAGQVGEMRFTIEVKRAETGKVDTYEFVGSVDPEKLKQIQAEQQKEQ